MARFVWPTPSDDFFRRHISDDEASALDYRIERNKFLWQEFGPPADMLLIGGITAMFALGELKRSYVYGNFMATVLLAQAFIEQSLGGMYALAGRDELVSKGFATLIDTSRAEGHTTLEIADSLHKLRKMRNPYTHQTIGVGKSTYMGRLVDSAFKVPEDLVVEDAEFAIRAVVDYLRHGSPDWNPNKVQWSEDDA